MKLKKVLEENYKVSIAIFAVLIAILALLLIPILKSNSQISNIGPTITDNSIINIKDTNTNTTLNLEVAATPQKRESGLMFRNSLVKDGGMIFIFSNESDLSFWMKNTSISLDMIFLDKNLKVTSIYSDTKPDQTTEIYNSKSPSQFVIETLAGWAQSNNIKVGDLFEIASIK